MKVLIVDDEETCVEAISHCLRRFGFETSTARGGLEALRQMDEEKPEVVITDINMPNMNGLELLKTIEKRFGDIPVILMTGQVRREKEMAAQATTAYACFNKPFGMKEVVEVLTRLRGNRHHGQKPEPFSAH